MRVISLIIALLLSSCVMSSPSGPSRAQAKVGDPALDGHDELLTEADFREVLRVSRAYLTKTTPWLTVHRVHVLSSTQIELFVGPYGEFGEAYHMFVERKKGVWEATSGAMPIMYVT